MSKYTIFNEKIAQPTDNPTELYNNGYLFGRKERNYLYQTRSLRLDLNKFKPSSENRRILRKFEIDYYNYILPLNLESIDFEPWQVQKLAKTFYQEKFSEVSFSASKIRGLLKGEQNFNKLLRFIDKESQIDGFCICYQNDDLLHYSYPFYDIEMTNSNFGMRIMLEAIIAAQLNGLRYVYLGGVTRPSDKYKLQFEGLSWWDEGQNGWETNVSKLKEILR